MPHQRGDMLPPVAAMNADRQAQRRGMGTHGAGPSAMPPRPPRRAFPCPCKAMTIARHGHGMGGEQNYRNKARPPRRPPHAPTVLGSSHRRGDMLPPVAAMNADRQAWRRGMGTHGAGPSAMPPRLARRAFPCPARAHGNSNGNARARDGRRTELSQQGKAAPPPTPCPYGIGNVTPSRRYVTAGRRHERRSSGAT